MHRAVIRCCRKWILIRRKVCCLLLAHPVRVDSAVVLDRHKCSTLLKKWEGFTLDESVTLSNLTAPSSESRGSVIHKLFKNNVCLCFQWSPTYACCSPALTPRPQLGRSSEMLSVCNKLQSTNSICGGKIG